MRTGFCCGYVRQVPLLFPQSGRARYLVLGIWLALPPRAWFSPARPLPSTRSGSNRRLRETTFPARFLSASSHPPLSPPPLPNPLPFQLDVAGGPGKIRGAFIPSLSPPFLCSFPQHWSVFSTRPLSSRQSRFCFVPMIGKPSPFGDVLPCPNFPSDPFPDSTIISIIHLVIGFPRCRLCFFSEGFLFVFFPHLTPPGAYLSKPSY